MNGSCYRCPDAHCERKQCRDTRPDTDRGVRRDLGPARPARGAQCPHHRQARPRSQRYHSEREPGQAEGAVPADRGRPGEPAARKQDAALRPLKRVLGGTAQARAGGACTEEGQARARWRINAGKVGNGPWTETGARRVHRSTRTGDVRRRPTTLPTSGPGTDPARRPDDRGRLARFRSPAETGNTPWILPAAGTGRDLGWLGAWRGSYA